MTLFAGVAAQAFFAAGLAILVFLVYQVNRLLRSTSVGVKSLKISEIYVYPIKSLRPTKLSSALATKYGFEHDRKFMLLQVTPEGYKNMAVSRYPDMTQFLTSIDSKDGKSSVKVTFRAFGDEGKTKILDVPLNPSTEKLEPFNVDMHGSPTAAFKMPQEYSSWFTDCFGYEVVLVYLGDYRRKVLFQDMVPTASTSLLSRIPLLKFAMAESPRITFADCAPYLLVSATSLDNVSSRLGPDEDMDVTKFRPNIVVSGADDAWEEDYWHKISVSGIELVMTHNCVRCASINVDYNTGKPGTGESGQALKKLQKDRRVDKGAKWSPVFGRYTFWNGTRHEQVFRVGDDVIVTAVNKERTAFNWPGIG